MYRIEKVLNHNAVIGADAGDGQEYLIMGKGAGFGKKAGLSMCSPFPTTV